MRGGKQGIGTEQMTAYDYVIIAGGIIAVLYGIIAGRWVISKDPGNARM